MGSVKRHLDDLMDPDRIEPQPGKYVSAVCFEDEALRKFVRRNLSDERCSYYRGQGKKPKGAPLDAVLTFIFDAFCSRYDDANNGVGWEDGFVGATTWDSYELVSETIDLSEKAQPVLLDDIAGALPDRTWSEIDPYRARTHQIFRWSWDKFVDVVKHERRFYFNEGESDDEENISPGTLLSAVANKCVQAGMVRKLPADTRFYRCRARNRGEHFTEPSDLGPPPKVYASQSRMSPAGIPMFYGAADEATARAETLKNHKARHTMALFGLSRPVHILDLTSSPTISIFDQRRRSLFDWAIFMQQFRCELSKKVEKDDRIHIEYVPTQIVTEYFRSFLKSSKGKPIDGILYRSATNTGQVCVALFANTSAVAPAAASGGSVDSTSDYLLQLLSVAEHK
jgi:hypothetical protein